MPRGRVRRPSNSSHPVHRDDTTVGHLCPVTESPHHRPGRPDDRPAAADPGDGTDPTDGAGEAVDPDVIPEGEDDGSSTDITDAVRERPDPPFRTPDTP